MKDLPAWERLFKKIAWKQLGDIKGKFILDFGSGEGITADHFAESNRVVAVEPWEEMLKNAWTDHDYRQIVGDINALSEFKDSSSRAFSVLDSVGCVTCRCSAARDIFSSLATARKYLSVRISMIGYSPEPLMK